MGKQRKSPGLRQRIGRFLSNPESEKVAGSTARPSATDGPVSSPDSARQPSSDARLKKLLSNKELISAGRLQVLGLDKIREHFGGLWEQAAEKVHTIAQRIIKMRITPTDVFIEYGDQAYPAYIILFGELTKEEAQIKCALIAEEVTRKILGEEIPRDMVAVKTIVATVDGGLAAEEVDTIGVIAQLLENQAGKVSTKPPSPASTTPQQPHGGQPPLDQSVELELVEAVDEVTHVALPEEALPDNVSFVYRPVWDVRKNVILTFRCIPTVLTPRGDVVTGYDVLGANNSRLNLTTQLDMLVLNQIRRDFETLQRDGRRLLLAGRVHFDTLANTQSFSAYLDLCRSLPDPLRRDMVFEVMNIPDGIPHMRLAQLIPSLKPFSRAVYGEVDLKPTDMDRFRGSGLTAVGIDTGKTSCSEANLMKIMNAFVIGANSAGLQTFVRRIKSRSMAIAAVGAGFDYVDGDVVAPFIVTLGEAHRFKPTDLFAQLLT